FKTAFVTYEEHVEVGHLFGHPDVVATDLEDAARQIIAHEDEHNEARGHERTTTDEEERP
ncbi:hypothetical protein JCM11491_005165, partial [Sporobolomyces phaffii]